MDGGSQGKVTACSAEDTGLILGREDPLEKGVTTHSSRIPQTKESGRLQSMGLQSQTWLSD